MDQFVSNLCKKTAGEPKISVRDNRNRPVVFADVTLRLPTTGATGVFTGGAATRTVQTDENGQVVVKGFVPNKVAGKYAVDVLVSLATLKASGTISGANVKQGCFPTAIVAVVGGAGAAGAAVLAGKGGGKSGGGATGPTGPTGPTVTNISITAGAPRVNP